MQNSSIFIIYFFGGVGEVGSPIYVEVMKHCHENDIININVTYLHKDMFDKT